MSEGNDNIEIGVDLGNNSIGINSCRKCGFSWTHNGWACKEAYTSSCLVCSSKQLNNENDTLKARIKYLEEKINEAHTLLSTVDQAGGKKHHRFAVGVPQDDLEVSFLTASFMKKVKAWLNGSPTQKGDKE